jgi:peptide/nickel transport system permease protein
VLKYIVRRVLMAIPVLFGLSLVLFAFVHLLPGDPTRAILGQHATPELVARLRESNTSCTSASSSGATLA